MSYIFKYLSVLTIIGMGMVSQAQAQPGLADERLTEAKNYMAIADSLFESSQPLACLPYLEKAATIFHDFAHWEDYYMAHSLMAKSWVDKGDYEQALSKANWVIDKSKARLGTNNKARAQALHVKGMARVRSGQYEEAMEFTLAAYEIRRRLYADGHPLLGQSLNVIGVIYQQTKQYEKALEYALLTLNARKQAFGPNHHKIARSYNNIGVCYLRLGQYQNALNSFEKQLSLMQKLGMENHASMVNLYGNLSILYQNTGAYLTALSYLEECLRLSLLHYGEKSIQEAITLINMGNLHFFLKDYNKAIDKAKRAVYILEDRFDPGHSYIITTKTNIGAYYLKLKDGSSANDWLEEALADNLKANGPLHHTNATIYLNLGQLHQLRNMIPEARDYFNRTIALTKKLNTEHEGEMVQAYLALSDISKTKNPKQALKYCQQALYAYAPSSTDTTHIMSNPLLADCFGTEDLLQTLGAKADIWVHWYKKSKAPGSLTAALETYALVDSLMQAKRHTLAYRNDMLLMNAEAAKILQKAVEAAWMAYQDTGDASFIDVAFQFAEHNKANMLLTKIGDLKAKASSNLPDTVINAEQQLKSAISNVQNQLATQKNGQEELKNTLFGLNQKFEAFTKRLETNFPAYYRLKYQDRTATIHELQLKLGEEDVLLSYSFGQQHSFVFVITKEATNMLPIMPLSELQPILDSYYNVLQNESPFAEFSPVSHQVYQALAAPTYPLIQSKRNLTIVHPTLISVPFESLLLRMPALSAINAESFSEGAFMIHQFAIKYHYSASLWYLSQERPLPTEAHRLLAMAPYSDGVSMALTTRKRNPALPESKTEVSKLYSLFKSKGLQADAGFATVASQSYLLKHAPSASVIHIATHSEANYRNEALARVHLAECLGQSDRHQTSCLYPTSIYTMAINADLVVLSSCDSGAGKLWQSEGVMSLGRAFLNAGAGQVVSSLWETEDGFSHLFMENFYRTFLDNIPYDMALRQAKSSFLGHPEWAHPKHWANFILIGG